MTWAKSPSQAQIQTQFSRYTQSTWQLWKRSRGTFHFLLSCSNYSDERLTLLRKIRNTNLNILENTNSQVTRFFPYGDRNFIASTNLIILSSTIEYILATKRFDKPIFHKTSYKIFILVIYDLGTSFC